MKVLLRQLIVFLFFCLPFLALGQNTGAPAPDDEFNIFLFSLAAVFICALLAAAMIGALFAMLVLCLLSGLMAVGIISTSVTVGLYKRSAAAGFKSFLLMLFGVGCAIIGCGGLYLVNHFARLPLSDGQALGTGLIAGLAGGLLMAVATWKMIRWLLQSLTRRFLSA